DVCFPDVVPNYLVVPAQFACLQIESDNRAQIEVGARPSFARKLRHTVSRDVVDDPYIRIRCTNEPHSTAATLPDRAGFRPRVGSWLAGRGHHEEAPRFFTGLPVHRDDLPTPPVVCAEPYRHKPARVERRTRDDLSLVSGFVTNVLVPDKLPGLLAKRDHTGV